MNLRLSLKSRRECRQQFIAGQSIPIYREQFPNGCPVLYVGGRHPDESMLDFDEVYYFAEQVVARYNNGEV